MQDDPKQQELKRRRQLSIRLNIFFFIVFGIFSVLLVRLAVLQFVEGPNLSAQSTKKYTRSDPIAPIRGNIYDANGYPIAYSTSTQSLYYNIQPSSKGLDSAEQAELMAKQLLEVFTKYGDPEYAMTYEDIIEAMDLKFRRNTMSTPRRIKSNLTNAELAYILENKTLFKGVEVLEESVRNYDENTIAVQLTGYLKKYNGVRESYDFYAQKREIQDAKYKYLEEEQVGADGLEYMYQDILRGTNGVKRYPVNNQGMVVGDIEITTPEKGADLYLTIDKDVQLHTEQSILNHIDKIKNSSLPYERAPNAQIGFAVAMEVQTGKVIAMASMPDYDPNVWAGGSISGSNWDLYQNRISNGTIRTVYGTYEDESEAKKHPSSIVPLGSTIKPLTVLIGLNEGFFTPSTTYYDNGVFQFGRTGYERKVRNSGGKSYGAIDGATAIAKSSNPFMAGMVGNRLYQRGEVDGKSSIEIWDEYMKQFGLGVSTGSGLLGESAGVIDYFKEAENASTQSALVFASFGQQGRYTALQLAQYTATLANRGVRLKPQFVNEIRSSDGELIQGYEAEVLNTADIPEAYWEEIEDGMERVGTQGFEYKFRRKTGTSEQQVAGKVVENAVFIAYAPAENPKLAVAVVIPEGGFGGWGAAPIARQIFDAYDAVYGLGDAPNTEKYEKLFNKQPETTEE